MISGTKGVKLVQGVPGPKESWTKGILGPKESSWSRLSRDQRNPGTKGVKRLQSIPRPNQFQTKGVKWCESPRSKCISDQRNVFFCFFFTTLPQINAATNYRNLDKYALHVLASCPMVPKKIYPMGRRRTKRACGLRSCF